MTSTRRSHPAAAGQEQPTFRVAADGELLTPAGRRLDVGFLAVGALVGTLLAGGGLLYQRIDPASPGLATGDAATYAVGGQLYFAVGLGLLIVCGLGEAVRRARIARELDALGYVSTTAYQRAYASSSPSTSRRS